jgi:hypothetical protein
MPTIRKGESIGPRREISSVGIEHLVNTSVDDCRSSARLASREQLIQAHRWCEQQGGHKTRRAVLAAALKKSELARETEQFMNAGGAK